MKNTFIYPFSGSQLTLLGALFVFLIGGVIGCTDFQVGPTEDDVAMEGYDLIMELPEAPATAKGPFIVVEQSPTLIGGLSGLVAKLKYPELAKRAGIQGRVFLQFIVQPDGSVIDPIVTRGIGGGCDEEAINLVRNARFIPGVEGGMRVAVKMSLPVTFRLNENGEPMTAEEMKEAAKTPAPRYPAVDVNDIVILDSMEEVDFEYDIVFVSRGMGGPDLGNAKILASTNGANYIIKGGPKNAPFFTGKQSLGRASDLDAVIGIRRK